MAINRENDINPLSSLYDNMKTIVSGIVVKFSSEADKYETFETKRYADEYLSALRKIDSFGIYDYTIEEYNEAGIMDNTEIKYYQEEVVSIPKSLQTKLLEIRRKNIIENYEEQNDYYREINGVPPLTTKGGIVTNQFINKSLRIVLDSDETLKEHPDSMRITESSSYAIMGNSLFTEGNYIMISEANFQTIRTNYQRSFLIVPDEFEVNTPKGRIIFVRDVKSIMHVLQKDVPYTDEEMVGKYLFISSSHVLDTTKYFKKSYLVVSDNIEEYDEDTMIKISEAKMNNKNVSLGDYMMLGSYHYVNDEIHKTYGISRKVPIHCIGDVYGKNFVSILESSGFLQKLIDSYPNENYLNFIGSKKVSIANARTARNFDILYVPSCDREVVNWVFATCYNSARDYFVNTVYNYYYRDVYEYYDNFIGLAIIQTAINMTVVKSMQTAIDRDFYDENMVRLLFEMYRVPYMASLPYQTQRRLVKNLNWLIQRKASSEVIYDIASILGYHDMTVYKYYLVKERKFDSNGNLIYADTTSIEPTPDINGKLVDTEVVINDLKKMYDVYFQKVDIKETNFHNALTDSSNRVDYDSLTQADPLWWDDSQTFDEVYGDYTKYTAETESIAYHKQYNYMETKYLGVTISYKMSEVLYDNIILFRMIFDKKDEMEDIVVTLPKITDSLEIKIFDLIVFLCALISKQNHLSGEILTKYSHVMDVMGYIQEDVDGYRPCDTLAFNFDILTNVETYKEVVEKPHMYLKPEEKEVFDKYLSIITLDYADIKEKTKAIDEMFKNIKGLGYFVGRKMSTAQNIQEYQAWRDFYNSIFIGQENAEMFQLGATGRVARTYLEYLSVMNPALYNKVMEAEDSMIYIYIDHAIARLETVVHDLNSLYAVNDSESPLLQYFIKLIKFFKSYTVDLVDTTTEYVFDSKPDNLFRLIDWYHIHQVDLDKDSLHLMYSDYIKIVETLRIIDPLKYNEWTRFYKTILLEDTSPINNVTCNKCKNFHNCRNYCRNNRNTCQGTYKSGSDLIECPYFGYDCSELLEVIKEESKIVDIMPYTDYADIMGILRNYIESLYRIYYVVNRFNPYLQEPNFSVDMLISNSYDFLNKLNEKMSKHGIDDKVYDNTLLKIQDLTSKLIVKGSDINRICKNKNFPCMSNSCHLNYLRETMFHIDRLFWRDPLLFTDVVDITASYGIDNDSILFKKDEILIHEKDVIDDGAFHFMDKINYMRDKITNKDCQEFRDTISSKMKLGTDDEMRFREELIMYFEE